MNDPIGVQQQRSIDMIDLAAAVAGPDVDKLHLDLSQSLLRKPWSCNVRSMVASSQFFSFARKRVLVPQEHLFLLGWHGPLKLNHLGSSRLRNLAGEGMGVPCVSFMSLCMLMSRDDLWQHPLPAGIV